MSKPIDLKTVRIYEHLKRKPSLENETFKSKQTSLLYDFYSTKNNKGFYKKVAPHIDGSFKTSKNAVSFQILKDSEDFILQFSSPWNKWVKKIKHLDNHYFFKQMLN